MGCEPETVTRQMFAYSDSATYNFSPATRILTGTGIGEYKVDLLISGEQAASQEIQRALQYSDDGLSWSLATTGSSLSAEGWSYGVFTSPPAARFYRIGVRVRNSSGSVLRGVHLQVVVTTRLV